MKGDRPVRPRETLEMDEEHAPGGALSEALSLLHP